MKAAITEKRRDPENEAKHGCVSESLARAGLDPMPDTFESEKATPESQHAILEVVRDAV
jgi:hypothetical protein